MAMNWATGAFGGLSILGGLGSGLAGIFGEGAEQSALDLKKSQLNLAYAQKQTESYEKLSKLLDYQRAKSFSDGTSVGSPSSAAVYIHEANQEAKEQQNLSIERQIGINNIEIEKANVKNKLIGSLFGDLATLGVGAATLFL